MIIICIAILIIFLICYILSKSESFSNRNIIYFIDNIFLNHSLHHKHYGHYDYIRSDLNNNGNSLNSKIIKL